MSTFKCDCCGDILDIELLGIGDENIKACKACVEYAIETVLPNKE